MEDLTSPTTPEPIPTDVLVQTLQRQRSHVDAFLAAHRQRLVAAEATLAAQIDRIARELVQVRSHSSHVEGSISTREQYLEQRARDVAQLTEQIEAAQTNWQAAQDRSLRQQQELADEIRRQQEALEGRLAELTGRHVELAEAEAKLHHESESVSLARQRNEEEARRLEAEREGLQRQRVDLEAQLAEVAAERTRTEEQRRRIAREFEARRAADRKDVEHRRAEIEERAAECAALETRRGEAAADKDESRRRYEMAVEDLRELRAENENLKKQLADLRIVGASARGSAPESLDWEAQKRRILEALESEFDENDADAAEERLRIERVIETTDRVVAEKDREIAELQVLLREQSGQVGAVAVGAEAFAEAIDKDAVVQEERENLKRLQEELREKLRKAEIDISIERAKIARERLEIDEKIRAMGGQDAAKASPDGGDSPPEKPARGRWLSRLGLRDADESDA